jgi:histone H3/H4
LKVVLEIRGVLILKPSFSLNVGWNEKNISLSRQANQIKEVLIASSCARYDSEFSMPPDELSTAAVRRLIEMAGADRVGDDAVAELGKVLEEYALKIGKEATELARHAGRKTVKAQDVELAVKRIPPPQGP